MEKIKAKALKPAVIDPLSNEVIEEERWDNMFFLTWGTKALPEKDSDGNVRFHPTTIAYCQLIDGQVVMVNPEWLILEE